MQSPLAFSNVANGKSIRIAHEPVYIIWSLLPLKLAMPIKAEVTEDDNKLNVETHKKATA